MQRVTRKSANFSETGESYFIKAKISEKARIFQGGSFLPSRFFLMGFLNFGCKSRHPALKFKPWIVRWKLIIGTIIISLPYLHKNIFASLKFCKQYIFTHSHQYFVLLQYNWDTKENKFLFFFLFNKITW